MLWHLETWDEVVNVVREHFIELGFEVHTNTNAGEATIIHRETRKALTITPISNTSHRRMTGRDAL